MVSMRPMSFGRFSSNGRIFFRPSLPSSDCACAAALITARLFTWDDVVGDGEEERIFEVEEMTPLDLSVRRSRARAFCLIRSA